MDIIIVSGFLGAGKTTFILEFIRRYAEDGERKIAVLVNEFGDLSIDGEVIRKGGLEVVELPSGCICCSLRASLPETIDMIYKSVKPDVLLIEPSGIATPRNVLVAIKKCRYAEKYTIRPVIGIVDATVFQEFVHEFGKFYRGQIETADILLINKIDLVSNEELDEIEKMMREINPQAMVVRTQYSKFVPEGGEHVGEVDDKEFSVEFGIPLESLSLVPQKKFSRRELEELVEKLVKGECGKVIRAKGFVECDGLYMFQISGESYEIREWGIVGQGVENLNPAPKAVFVGSDLKVEELKRVFGSKKR